jgi:hypothetical protein
MSMWKSQVLMAQALLTEVVLWVNAKFLSTMGCKFYFFVFFEGPLHVASWLKLPNDRVPKKALGFA